MKRKLRLCPSMMCAKYAHLEEEVEKLENAGVDVFHIDIMDGQFVPNFAMGVQDVRCICDKSKIDTEIHLMIQEPYKYIGLFKECGANIIYIHPESELHPITTLQKIQEMEMESGIVLSPGVSVYSIIELLNVTNRVIVMGVNPGEAGQIYLPYAEKKIDSLIKLQKEYPFCIGMDGACNIERISRLYKKGVENFVLGTAGLFYDDFDYKTRIKEIRKAAEDL